MISVLIPARNEEETIGRTLDSLPRGGVAPLVIGNDCTDKTLEIADSFGAETIEVSERGKILAIQNGLKYLGNRAVEPFIILDADTRPISDRWAEVMSGRLREGKSPSMIAGPAIFWDNIDFFSGIYHSFMPTYRARRLGNIHLQGCNLAFRLPSITVIDEIIQLENYFGPGDEGLLAKVVSGNGGTVEQTLDPRAAVLTDGHRLSSFIRSNKGKPSFQESYT